MIGHLHARTACVHCAVTSAFSSKAQIMQLHACGTNQEASQAPWVFSSMMGTLHKWMMGVLGLKASSMVRGKDCCAQGCKVAPSPLMVSYGLMVAVAVEQH